MHAAWRVFLRTDEGCERSSTWGVFVQDEATPVKNTGYTVVQCVCTVVGVRHISNFKWFRASLDPCRLRKCRKMTDIGKQDEVIICTCVYACVYVSHLCMSVCDVHVCAFVLHVCYVCPYVFCKIAFFFHVYYYVHVLCLCNCVVFLFLCECALCACAMYGSVCLHACVRVMCLQLSSFCMCVNLCVFVFTCIVCMCCEDVRCLHVFVCMCL